MPRKATIFEPRWESRGYLCQKAARLDYYQNHTDRLTHPLKRQPDGTFLPVSWESAVADIAKRLVNLREQHGGATVVYYGGGGQGNHLGGVYASALRHAIGTPFVYSALAQEKTGDFWVNGRLFGRQTCHVTSDVKHAEFVMFLGTNPWQSHGFARARKVLREINSDPARTMVVIDPRRTETARMADIHLQVRPGTDAFLLGAILGILVAEELLDKDFLAQHCVDSETVIQHLERIPVAEFIKRADVNTDDVRRVAFGLGRARSAVIRADLGIQQSLHSTLNSYLEKLLFLLTGNFGRMGTNTFHSFLVPLIGHSPDPNEDPRVELSSVTRMRPISKLYPPNILPQEITGDHPKHVRTVFVDSANPLVSAADTHAYRAAFKQLELLVVIDVALTETAQLADYVLPASSQFEKTEATFFNLSFPRNVFQLRAPIVEPLPGTLPEPEIYRRICVAMGALPARFRFLEAVARWGGRRAFGVALRIYFARHPDAVGLAPLVLYDTLGKTLPEKMQSAAVLWASAILYGRRHPEAVRRAGHQGSDLGAALFDSILTSPSGLVFSEHLYEDSFAFIRHEERKIHLSIPEMLEQLEQLNSTTEPTRDEFPFVLLAGERRSYNANTIYRDPAWRKTDREGALRIHPNDADRLGLVDGDRVSVSSRSGTVESTIERNEDIRHGVVSLPHGYGLRHPTDDNRVATGPPINELTGADHCDAFTKTPFHKTVPVRIEVTRAKA